MEKAKASEENRKKTSEKQKNASDGKEKHFHISIKKKKET